jgi:hypothetical protein
MNNTYPTTWSSGVRTAFVSIAAKSGTDYEFMTIISDISESGGDKPVEQIVNLAGGNLKNYRPQEPVTIDLTLYAPAFSSTTTDHSVGMLNFMYAASDVTDPISFNNDRTRQDVRLVILKTDDPSVTKATSATASTYAAKRETYVNGDLTTHTTSVNDGLEETSCSFTFFPYDKDGTANFTYEQTKGTGGLPAISAYS